MRGQWDRIKREQEGREGIFHDVPDALPALLLARKLQERAAAVGFDWETAHEAFPKIAEEHAELAEALGLLGPLRLPEPTLPRRLLLGTPSPPEAEEGEGVEGRSRSRAEGTAERSEPAGESRPGERRPEASAPSSAPLTADAQKERLRHEVGDLLFAVVNVARKAGVDPELALRRAALRFEQRVCAAASLAQQEGSEWTALELAEQETYYRAPRRQEAQQMTIIVDVVGRQILDSRGNPTVEVEVELDVGRRRPRRGAVGRLDRRARGRRAARRRRARTAARACARRSTTSTTIIAEELIGFDATDQRLVDQALIALDGTPNKAKLGANAILGCLAGRRQRRGRARSSCRSTSTSAASTRTSCRCR